MVVNVLDSDMWVRILVELLHSLSINTIEKSMNPLILSAMGQIVSLLSDKDGFRIE